VTDSLRHPWKTKFRGNLTGSRAKRDAVLKGENLIDLINAKRPAGYRIGTLEDAILKDVKPDNEEWAWIRERLLKAQERVWPENSIKPRGRMARDALAALESASEQHPDAAEFLARLRANQYRVDSLEWHYFKYRYQYGDDLPSAETLNARFDRVLEDVQSRVSRSGDRLKVFSPNERRLAIIDGDGRRVSVYRLDDQDVPDWWDDAWNLTNLFD
jgi:hypothetical protein